MKKKALARRILLSLVLAGLLIMTASPAMAAKIKVNSTDDIINPTDGSCTLREAIIAANTDAASGSIEGECQAGNGADKIVLKDHIYFLSIAGTGEDNAATGDLDILDDLTVKGKGANRTFINGNKIDRVFQVIIGNVKVNLEGVTIQNGLSDYGGGIYNYNGTLMINNSTVSNNIASNDGGGIYNFLGTITITESEVSNNKSIGSAGGIYNQGTSKIIKSSIFGNEVSGTGPRGGGISNQGTMIITKSTVFNNMSSGTNFAVGGGIYNYGTLTITKSTVSYNRALGTNSAIGGGIDNQGTLTITKSTVSNNSGSGDIAISGGIDNQDTLTITKSTVSNNSAMGVSDAYGGGIRNTDSLTIEGQTKIFNNFSSDYGGGIYDDGGTLDISPNSKVFKNIPNDIE